MQLHSRRRSLSHQDDKDKPQDVLEEARKRLQDLPSLIANEPDDSTISMVDVPGYLESEILGKGFMGYRTHGLYTNVTTAEDGLYHCPWEGRAGCLHRPVRSKSDYDKCIDSHLSPYRCNFKDCEGIILSSTAALLYHERVAHGLHSQEEKPLLCHHDGCERGSQGNGFPALWNLKNHLKLVHGEVSQEPLSTTAKHAPPLSVDSRSSMSSVQGSLWSRNSVHSSISDTSTTPITVDRLIAPLPLPPRTTTTHLPPLREHKGYWCTSCNTSFKRKYDWKRHYDEFHERWKKYPCPEPGCSRSFWGDATFNQHHKQCHGCTTCPHADKVVRYLRKRKYWACGFCSYLHLSQERHLEHVARHFESGMTMGEWNHSRVIYGLLHQPLIVEAWDQIKKPEYGTLTSSFTWNPSTTGRAEGFIEKGNPGNLQDLLEFFVGDEGDAQQIAAVAYNRADIILKEKTRLNTEAVTTGNLIASSDRMPPHHWVPALVRNLSSNLIPSMVDEETQKRVCKILPDLLQAFAVRIWHHRRTQMHLDFVSFVYRNTRDITKAFMKIAFGHEKRDHQENVAQSNEMSLQDRMNLWIEKESLVEVHYDLGLLEAELDFEKAFYDEKSSDLHLIFETEAYQWLRTCLQREFHLSPTQPNVMDLARAEVLYPLLVPANLMSMEMSPVFKAAMITVDWDIFHFFTTQWYSGDPHEIFEKIITITGSSSDAQAVTCVQYMRQTWPLTGRTTVNIIKQTLGGEKGSKHRSELSDGTFVTTWIESTKFMMKITGLAPAIAEMVEQLSWLGAALRTSPQRKGLVSCTPHISNNHCVSPLIGMNIGIDFILEGVPMLANPGNGQCWHNAFKNPVIAKGFPIPKRKKRETGLEIPFHIMAGLAQTNQVDRFKENIYLKSFSTLLVPTKRENDTLYWHLIYNEDGGRISYLDDFMKENPQLGSLDLENLRHILGWCSEAKFYAGTIQARHPVTRTRLPRPQEGCALAGTRVSAGQIIKGGSPFSIGNKDIPIHLTRDGYISKLEWISTKFVLLWDDDDKRGWLVNGTSALLYLLRVSLTYSSQGKFRSALLCRSEDLEESPEPFTADSAVGVLINKKNRHLKLYEEGDGYILLQSLIERFYTIIEKLIDHQIDITGDNGDLDKVPRRYLEGWDFEDLAKKQDPLYPCVADLSAAGKGWVDFTRAVHAVTLIGRGFGEIIQPIGAGLCEYWAELPKQQYYIASCLSDLVDVMREHASDGTSHVRVGDNLIWHTPTTVFASCKCKGALRADHSEPVQTFFPLPLVTRLLPRKQQIPACNGAVIFGHSSSFPWVWGDAGFPKEGGLDDGTCDTSVVGMKVASPLDSGIGSSLTLSRSDSPLSGRSAFSPRHSPSMHYDSETGPQFPSSSVNQPRFCRDHYKAGILCALPKELMAIRALFDDDHGAPPALPSDSNQYSLGVMKRHWVVAACLPHGEYGTNSAAAAAANMKRSFNSIRFCLLVGIAGGAPSRAHDVRLGDVVVSNPSGNCSGVIQYDLGKEKEGRHFERTGSLPPPPRVLSAAVSSLCSDPDLPSDPLTPYLRSLQGRLREFSKYQRPQGPDVLYQPLCRTCRKSRVSQDACSHQWLRQPRQTLSPVVHYGLIASGNRVVKDAILRDRLAEDGVLCIEMEAAGVLNTVECLVIRGICDYCDMQKNDEWQEYAAAVAAAYAKLLLGYVANEEQTWLPRKRRKTANLIRHYERIGQNDV